MNYLTLEGSERTHRANENMELMKNATPFPIEPFRLFVFNYERWLYHALKLDKKNPRLQRLRSTQNHILLPDEDTTIYLKKTIDFPSLMRNLVSAYLPFQAGLMDALEVSLWDEGDKFQDMTVTSIEKKEDDFVVFYNHPDGSLMEVKGSELGDDEILNVITALIEHNDGNMAILPLPVKETVTIQSMPDESDNPPMPNMEDFYYDPFQEDENSRLIEEFFL